MNEPGVRLRRLASRWFHAATMELVISPALADLQLECVEARSRRGWRRAWICLRAYLSFWLTVIVQSSCSLIDGPPSPSAVDAHAARRAVLTGALVAGITTAVMVLAVPLTMTGSIARLRAAFGGNIAHALVLLMPQAFPISGPAGLLFGTLWGVRQRPASRSVRRMILILGVCAAVFSGVLLESAIPAANQAFRVAVFRDARGLPPAKGGNELTWRELRAEMTRRHAAGPSSQVRQLRLAYQGRFAIAATPVVFALLAATALRRRRTHRSMVGGFAGLAAYSSYYTLIGWPELVGTGAVSPTVVAWTPNMVALIITIALAASPAASASSAVETR